MGSSTVATRYWHRTMDGITGLETSVILDVVKFSYEWEIA
jgi:hypothetical protein